MDVNASHDPAQELLARLAQVPGAVVERIDHGPSGTQITLAAPAPDLASIATAMPTHQTTAIAQAGGRLTIHVPPRTSPRPRQVAVHVPVPLAEAVRRERARTRRTATEQMWDAYTDHHEALTDRLVTRRAALGLPPSSARRRRDPGPTTQLWLTLTPPEIAKLDAIAGEWTGGNRSAAATVILTERHPQSTH